MIWSLVVCLWGIVLGSEVSKAAIAFNSITVLNSSSPHVRIDPVDTIIWPPSAAMVIANGTLYGTKDGGLSWSPQWRGGLSAMIPTSEQNFSSLDFGSPTFFPHPETGIVSKTRVTIGFDGENWMKWEQDANTTWNWGDLFGESLELSIESGGRVVLDDGEMIATGVMWGAPNPPSPSPYPSPPGPCCNGSVLAFSSTDGGVSWTAVGIVATKEEVQPSQEGANENNIAILADGRLFTVVRIDGGDGVPDHKHVPYVISYSSDKGRTWTTPTSLPSYVLSCKPKVAATPTRVLLSGGRPGVRLWEDESGAGSGPWTQYDLPTEANALLPTTSPYRYCDAFLNASSSLGWAQSSGYTTLNMFNNTAGLVCLNRQGFPSGGYSKPIPKECVTESATIMCMTFTVS